MWWFFEQVSRAMRGPRTSSGYAMAAAAVVLGVCALALYVTLLPLHGYRLPGVRPLDKRAMLTAVHKAFTTYAKESDLRLYPRLDLTRRGLRPDLAQLGRFLAGTPEGQEFGAQLESGGTYWCYPGYAVINEDTALTLLDVLEQQGVESLKDEDIRLTGRTVRLLHDPRHHMIHRLTSHSALTLRTDIGNPSEYYQLASMIPIVWEIPSQEEPRGGWVLYLDGLAKWRRYPGEYPMTRALLERLARLYPEQEPRTLSENAASPVAGCVEEIVSAPAMWEWRNAEVLQCDVTPTIRIGRHAGYDAVLRRAWVEETPATPPAQGWVQTPTEEHMEWVLFPATLLATYLLDRIPWESTPNEQGATAYYVGRKSGFDWYVRTTITKQHDLRRELNLEGGGDELPQLTRHFDSCTTERERGRALGMLADLGERALPRLRNEAQSVGSPHRHDAIRCIGEIPGRSATKLLLEYRESDEPFIGTVATRALIEGVDRPEAKPIVLGLLRNWRESPIGVHELARKAANCGWTEAVPWMEDVIQNTGAYSTYVTMVRAKRDLEGRPYPRELDAARAALLEQLSSYRRSEDDEVVLKAKATIAESVDEEAQFLCGLDLAMFCGGGKAGDSSTINAFGLEILRSLPRETTLPVVRRLYTNANNELMRSEMGNVLRSLGEQAEGLGK